MLKTAASPGYFLNTHVGGGGAAAHEGRCRWDTHKPIHRSYLCSTTSMELKTKEVGGKPNQYPAFPLKVASSNFRSQGRRAIWLKTLDMPSSK